MHNPSSSCFLLTAVTRHCSLAAYSSLTSLPICLLLLLAYPPLVHSVPLHVLMRSYSVTRHAAAMTSDLMRTPAKVPLDIQMTICSMLVQLQILAINPKPACTCWQLYSATEVAGCAGVVDLPRGVGPASSLCMGASYVACYQADRY